MKTDDLIAVLSADTTLKPPRPVLRAAAGAGLSLLLLLLFWTARPDLAQVVATPLVAAKFLLPLALAVLAAALWPRPEGGRALWPLLLPALAAGALFLLTMPAQNLPAAIAGSSWAYCLASIPALALPVGAGLFVALRRSVVTAPARAGLLAGLLAGAIATMLYALHCTEDAPSFYTVWYSAAVLICGTAGRWAGSRLLGV